MYVKSMKFVIFVTTSCLYLYKKARVESANYRGLIEIVVKLWVYFFAPVNRLPELNDGWNKGN